FNSLDARDRKFTWAICRSHCGITTARRIAPYYLERRYCLMTKNQVIYCRDILERIERIERYTTTGRASFLKETLIQDAVVRSFEIIGEVVKRLDETTKSKAPNIIWSDFAGF